MRKRLSKKKDKQEIIRVISKWRGWIKKQNKGPLKYRHIDPTVI
jgi:hypothetical protein